MMMTYTRYNPVISLLLFIAICVNMPGCDGTPTDPVSFHKYRMTGTVIVDDNLARRTTVFSILRNDSILDEALLLADSTRIPFRDLLLGFDSIYALIDPSAPAQKGGETELILDDTHSSIKTSIAVPDTFSILSLSPPNHLIRGLDVVTLDWSGSTLAETYVMAAVKTDSIYSGAGYALYATSFNTAGTIPAQAFIADDGITIDTGLYNIYVYAIAGSPDSTLAHDLLPTLLPSQLPDSTVSYNLTTRFGSVHVLLKDTVRVASIP